MPPYTLETALSEAWVTLGYATALLDTLDYQIHSSSAKAKSMVRISLPTGRHQSYRYVQNTNKGGRSEKAANFLRKQIALASVLSECQEESGIFLRNRHSKIQPKKFFGYYGKYLVFILHQNTDVVFSCWCLAYGSPKPQKKKTASHLTA